MRKLELCFSRWGRTGMDRMVIYRMEIAEASPVQNSRDALLALKKGVTEWVRTTEEGRRLWEYSSEDLNIGDLASYLEDASLLECLKRRGIEGIDLLYEVVEGEEISYDHVLVDGDELDPGDDS